jgi:hypothetical protein
MAILKNTAGQKFYCFAYNKTTGLPVTGDAANITAYLSKDGAAATQTNDANPTELDATNLKGWYAFDAAQAESNAEVIILSPVSTTANVIIDQSQIFTQAAPVPAAADIRTAVGLESANLDAQLAAIVEDTGTTLPEAIGDLSTFDPETEAVTLDTTQPAVTFGQVKIIANIANEGGLHIVNSGADGEGIHAQGAGYGQHNTGAYAGSYNEADGPNSAGQRNESSGANGAGQYNLASASGGSGQYDYGVSRAMTLGNSGGDPVEPMWARPGSAGDTLESLSDQIDAIPTTAAPDETAIQAAAEAALAAYDAATAADIGGIPAAPTAGDVADAVWDEARAGHTTDGTYGDTAEWAGSVDTAAIADAVWDEAREDHATADTFGAVDEWAGAGGGATAAEVWAHATRTLTTPAGEPLPEVYDAGRLNIHRGDTFSASITGLGGLAARTKLYWTIKDDRADADAASSAKVEETAGLQVLNGAVAQTATDGDITVDDEAAGDVTLLLKAAATATLTPGRHFYDIQMVTAATVATVATGMVVVSPDVTRATS